jgi:hypothetical protein
MTTYQRTVVVSLGNQITYTINGDSRTGTIVGLPVPDTDGLVDFDHFKIRWDER